MLTFLFRGKYYILKTNKCFCKTCWDLCPPPRPLNLIQNQYFAVILFNLHSYIMLSSNHLPLKYEQTIILLTPPSPIWLSIHLLAFSPLRHHKILEQNLNLFQLCFARLPYPVGKSSTIDESFLPSFGVLWFGDFLLYLNFNQSSGSF